MTKSLLAYQLQDTASGFALVPGSATRQWMDETIYRSAYRCLPLTMANQSGWMVLNNATIRAKWDGGSNPDAIVIEGEGQPLPTGAPGCTSHFGDGTLTWVIPWVFRTPKGYNMLAKGPANYIKDGVAPLEGLVETDWAVASFTMNWKITRPHHWVEFAKGEPIAQLVPQRRGELEDFVPEILLIDADPELTKATEAWMESRAKFHEDYHNTTAKEKMWERHYHQGTSPDGTSAEDHQTRRHLLGFVDYTTQAPKVQILRAQEATL